MLLNPSELGAYGVLRVSCLCDYVNEQIAERSNGFRFRHFRSLSHYHLALVTIEIWLFCARFDRAYPRLAQSFR